MEFWVKLIKVSETKNRNARDNLYANCTHVANDYWLYEGDEEFLDAGMDYAPAGIDFTVIGEEAIESYGDLTGSELKKMVLDIYGVDTSAQQE